MKRSKFTSVTLALGLFVAVAVAAAPALAQSVRIGVFDPQRLSESTGLGKEMLRELEALQSRKQDEIDRSKDEITTLQQRLSEQRLSLSSDTRAKMEMDIQRRLLAFEAAQEMATREMQLELSAAKGAFEEKLLIAVEQFGRDEGFQILLDRSLVAFATPAVDVTGALVERFNEMFPAGN